MLSADSESLGSVGGVSQCSSLVSLQAILDMWKNAIVGSRFRPRSGTSKMQHHPTSTSLPEATADPQAHYSTSSSWPESMRRETSIAGRPSSFSDVVEVSDNSGRRPKFILHVGLPKTGTSFLQCSLCSQANVTEPILLMDSWVYLGTCPYQTCGLEERPKQFLRHGEPSFITETSEVEPTFVGLVDRLRELKRNVLVIFEGLHVLDDGRIRSLASFLNKEDWDVQVLVAYRPLYQWLPSKYNSVTKRMDTLYEWPGRPIPDTRKVGEHWVPFDLRQHGNGGALRRLMRQINETNKHFAESVLQNYAVHFNASVIPLHDLPPVPAPDVDPLLNYLFCVLLKDSSPHVCEAIRSRRIGSDIPRNPSIPINYDMLATAAFEAGIIDKSTTLKRSNVGDTIRHRQELDLNRTANDFELSCLPEQTLDELKGLSWRLEKSMFPEINEEKAKQKHHEGFAKSVASKAFCWVDTNKTLSDPTWRSFLEVGLL